MGQMSHKTFTHSKSKGIGLQNWVQKCIKLTTRVEEITTWLILPETVTKIPLVFFFKKKGLYQSLTTIVDFDLIFYIPVNNFSGTGLPGLNQY